MNNRTVNADLIRLGESSTLEFKTEDVHNDSIAKEIVAFANFSGGKILLGVDDDGKIAGISDRSLEQRIVQVCRNNVVPSIIPVVEFVEIGDKIILAVEIPKGTYKPYRVKHSGKFYIRAGSSSVEPSNEELVRLFQNGEAYHYENQAIHGSGIDDLNRGYIDNFFRKHGLLDRDFESNPQLLEALSNLNFVLRSNDEYVSTVAGLILFGSHPRKYLPQSGAQAASFRGMDEGADLVEIKEFSGPAPDVIEGLMRFVERNSSTKVEFSEGIKRIDIEQFPAAVVRELIANAVAHRDYSIWGATIRLFVFGDHLEVRSPGKLPNTMTVDRMKMGVSYHRNPTIMQALKDLGYVEKIGRGILRSNRKLRELNRKELDILDLGVEVRVTLFGD